MKSIYEFLLKTKTTTSTQDNDCVDLGLPSGLLWAKCNIGAEKPTDYGDYFMWGSTEPDTNNTCDWAHMPFNNGSDDYDEIYFNSVKDSVCPNGTLTPEYDAATVILGPDWRLPTYDDFNELLNNTTNTWVTNYQNSKMNGMLFTSKNGEAAKANDTYAAELFIPASGYRVMSSFNYRGYSTRLWSSSLNASSPRCAIYLYGNVASRHMGSYNRYYGLCLRGVKET